MAGGEEMTSPLRHRVSVLRAGARLWLAAGLSYYKTAAPEVGVRTVDVFGLAACPKPVIAAINGFAVAGGCGEPEAAARGA